MDTSTYTNIVKQVSTWRDDDDDDDDDNNETKRNDITATSATAHSIENKMRIPTDYAYGNWLTMKLWMNWRRWRRRGRKHENEWRRDWQRALDTLRGGVPRVMSFHPSRPLTIRLMGHFIRYLIYLYPLATSISMSIHIQTILNTCTLFFLSPPPSLSLQPSYRSYREINAAYIGRN